MAEIPNTEIALTNLDCRDGLSGSFKPPRLAVRSSLALKLYLVALASPD